MAENLIVKLKSGEVQEMKLKPGTTRREAEAHARIIERDPEIWNIEVK